MSILIKNKWLNRIPLHSIFCKIYTCNVIVISYCFFIAFLECKTPKNIQEQIGNEDRIDSIIANLRMTVFINNISKDWKITCSNSSTTYKFELPKPSAMGVNSKFIIYDSNSSEITRRCAWTIPYISDRHDKHKNRFVLEKSSSEMFSNSDIDNLEAIFCKIDPTYYLTYKYSGFVVIMDSLNNSLSKYNVQFSFEKKRLSNEIDTLNSAIESIEPFKDN